MEDAWHWGMRRSNISLMEKKQAQTVRSGQTWKYLNWIYFSFFYFTKVPVLSHLDPFHIMMMYLCMH